MMPFSPISPVLPKGPVSIVSNLKMKKTPSYLTCVFLLFPCQHSNRLPPAIAKYACHSNVPFPCLLPIPFKSSGFFVGERP